MPTSAVTRRPLHQLPTIPFSIFVLPTVAPIATPCFWGRVFGARVEEAVVTTLCDPTMGCSSRGARAATGSCPSLPPPGTTARCSAYRCQCEAWVARSHHRGRRRHQRSKVILHKHPTAAAPDSEEVAGSPMNLPPPLSDSFSSRGVCRSHCP